MNHIRINRKKLDKDRYRETELLTHKCSISVAVGERRVGKTFDVSLCAILEALENEEVTFSFWRLTKKEIQLAKEKFFDDFRKFEVFPDYSFKIVGNFGYATYEKTGYSFPICYFGTLKDAQSVKGCPFPTIRRIIVDEWIEENGTQKVKAKLTLLWSLIYTTFVLKPIRVIILANAVTIEDPLFKQYGITNIDRPFTKVKGKIVVENTDKEKRYAKFKKRAKESAFGQLVKGSTYESYALDNKFYMDDTTNVKPKYKQQGTILCTISLEKHLLCVSEEKDASIFIKEVNKPQGFGLTPFTSDVNHDIIYVRSSDSFYKKLFKLVLARPFAFSNLTIKNLFMNLLEKSMGNTKFN